jgi:hypothetical protein
MNDFKLILPAELFDGRYELNQIGAICLVLASPNFNSEVLEKWSNDKQFHKLTEDMIKSGLIIVEDDDKLTIDLKTNNKTNMKIKEAMNQIALSFGADVNDCDEVQNILEAMAFEFYSIGYEDAKIDLSNESEIFVGYGKKEDF